MVNQDSRDLLRAKTWLMFLVAMFAAAQAILLADGMLENKLDLYRAAIILSAAAILAVICALPYWRATLRSRFEPALGGTTLGRIGLISLWSWSISAWIQLLVVTWLRPVYDWDGLYYHIPTIHGWMQSGHISWVDAGPDLPYVNGYPMGMEALSFLGTALLGTDRWLDGANLFFWPIGALALYVVARRLGSAKGWSLAAAAALSGVPIFVAQSTTAYVDPGFACAMMALFAAALEMVRRATVSNAVLLGFTAALVIATKGLGIPFAVIIFAAVVGFTIIGRPAAMRRNMWGFLPISAAIAILFGGGWLLRNTMMTGNPIFPVEMRLADWTIFEGIDVRAHILLNLPEWLANVPPGLRALISWTQPGAPIIHYGAISGLGFIWLVAGLPAILALIVEGARSHGWGLPKKSSIHRALPFLFLFSVGLILILWQPANWWARFTVWLHVLGLPSIAVVMTRSFRMPGSSSQRALTALCTLLFCIVLGESVFSVRGQWEDGLLDPVNFRYRSSAEYVFPGIETSPGFDELMESDKVARSSWSHWGALMGGVLSQPLGAREMEMLPTNVSFSDLRSLHLRGFSVVLWDVGAAGPAPQSLRNSSDLIGEFSDRPGLQFELWRLDPSALDNVAR